MPRIIIKIDEEKCTGCGLCVPSCAEGALQVVDGKARLVSEVFCDGLGACLGECPEKALTLEERDAPPFDEEATVAHLAQGVGVLPCGCPSSTERVLEHGHAHHAATNEGTLPCGCPSSSERALQRPIPAVEAHSSTPSELGHWPVQLALVSPRASFLHDSSLLVAADCVAFACPDFHRSLLKGHTLLVGCPKLDDTDPYIKKLAAIIALNNLQDITVAHMEVPCCFALVQLVHEAVKQSGVQVPVRSVTAGVEGDLEDDGEDK